MAWLYRRMQQRVDSAVYALTGGRTTLSAWAAGLPLVMLTTTGARTGRRRTLPVLGVFDGETVVVIASNYGQRRHPAWYHNLRAHPRAAVTVEGVPREVEAHELAGEEAERYFQRGAEMYPGFAHYRRWAAGRRIPVVRLEPVSWRGGGIP
jgi:deazaflavin-dependent oxidoreductase (nitroreductase family)